MAPGFPDRADCVRLGRHIAEQQNRLFTNDMMRQTFTLALMRNYLDLRSNGDCNLVIGDGYGVLATLFAMHAPHRKTIAVNLTKPLLLDLAYFTQALPEAGMALVADGDAGSTGSPSSPSTGQPAESRSRRTPSRESDPRDPWMNSCP